MGLFWLFLFRFRNNRIHGISISTYQTLLIVMVAFSEDNRAFVFISSIVCRKAAFDFKSGTIGKLSVMTIANLVGG